MQSFQYLKEESQRLINDLEGRVQGGYTENSRQKIPQKSNFRIFEEKRSPMGLFINGI